MKQKRIIDGVARVVDIDEFDVEAENASVAIRGHNELRPEKKFYKQRRLQQCFPYNEESISRLAQV